MSHQPPAPHHPQSASASVVSGGLSAAAVGLLAVIGSLLNRDRRLRASARIVTATGLVAAWTAGRVRTDDAATTTVEAVDTYRVPLLPAPELGLEPDPPVRPVQGGRARLLGSLIVLVGGWLLVSPLFLDYPFTASAQDKQMREYGAAIIVVLGGLWLHQHPRSGGLAALLCAVAGILLVVAAAVAPPALPRVQANEIVCGGLLVALPLAREVLRRAR
ncbi:MAG: hypothetical protein ACR2KL_04500 [Nocardioidaceae bacterium]